MDKTRDEMNGNQRMLLSYLEPLVPEDDVLMGMADFKPGVICFAIQVAGEHDVQSRGALKYLRAIIAGWKRLKVTTLDQAKKAAAGHDKRMANGQKSAGYSKPRRKEIVPDWAQQDANQSNSKPVPNGQVTAEQKQALADRVAKLER